MVGTFGALNTAKTGLQYQQVALDTANNNIANVNNSGYVRRQAIAGEIGGATTPVMWSTDGNPAGQGVTTQEVKRVTDALVDQRVRQENANLAYLSAKDSSLSRLESGISEPSDTGVAAALDAFVQSWQDVVSNPGGDGSTSGPAARQGVIAAGQTLAAAINTQARNVIGEADNVIVQAQNDVTQVNADAQQIAQLNQTIKVAGASGTDVSDLEDQRDALALDMAQLAGAQTQVQPDGQYTVTVNGAALVQGNYYGTLGINNPTSGSTDWDGTSTLVVTYTPPPQNSDQAAGVGYPPKNLGQMTTMGGDLGGAMAMLQPTYPAHASLKDYLDSLNSFAQQLANSVNGVLGGGYDLNGNAAAANPTKGYFFTNSDDPNPPGTMTTPWAPGSVDSNGVPTGYQVTALNISIGKQVEANPDLLAVSDTGANFDSGNADKVYQGLIGGLNDPNYPNLSAIYQSVVSGLGTTISALDSQTKNQQSLTTQVTNERQQLVGVSIDEETINLMQAARAYQASSRVISTMDDILDTLINKTG